MVSSEAIRTAVGILGNAISLGLFLSPTPTFVRIWKKGSVEKFSPFPYLATLLNCMMWVVYGLPMVHPHSILVISINGSGIIIELSFVLLFLLYSQRNKRLMVLALLLGEIAFVGVVALLVLTLAHTHDRRSLIVGVICVCLCAMMYASPLSVMKMVIQTRSVEFMPLFLSLASFFNGTCWTAYALIRFDPYIIIPNALGVMLAVAQLILYAMYYKSTKEQMEAKKNAAEMGLAEVVVTKGDANKISDTPNGCKSEIHEM